MLAFTLFLTQNTYTNLQVKNINEIPSYYENIKSEINNFNTIIKTVNSKLKSVINSKINELLIIQKNKTSANNNTQKFELQISDLNDEIDVLRTKLINADDKLKDIIKKCKNDMDLLQQQLIDKNLEQEKFQNQENILKKHIKKLELQLETNTKKITNEHENKYLNVQKELNRNQFELVNLKKSLQQNESEHLIQFNKLTKENQEIKEELLMAQNKLNDMMLKEKLLINVNLASAGNDTTADEYTVIVDGGAAGEGESINFEKPFSVVEQSSTKLEEIEILKNQLKQITSDAKSNELENLKLVKKIDHINLEHNKMIDEKAQEILSLNDVIKQLQLQFDKMEIKLQKKVAIIIELEMNHECKSNEIVKLQNELSVLRDSELEKLRDIKTLKYELSKAQSDVKQHEETILMHQRLLHIRSELISSMQEKDDTTRSRIADLYSDIDKKTMIVNRLNHEVSVKAEELENLFSTLGTKQMQVTRQDHIIQMLETNNERYQLIRVKQDQRITNLELENEKLQQMLNRFNNQYKINNNHHQEVSDIITSSTASKNNHFVDLCNNDVNNYNDVDDYYDMEVTNNIKKNSKQFLNLNQINIYKI